MRTWTGVCLAAVLLAVTGGCGTQTGPAATPRLPPPTLPYLADGRLHAGGTTLPTDADQLVVSDGTTLVGRVREEGSRWWLLDHGRLVPVLDEAGYVVPVLSADGGTAAWVAELSSTPTGDRTSTVAWEVTAYDVPTRSVLGRTRLEGPVTCCDQGGALVVADVANDGRVALVTRTLLSWRAGDEPAPASWRDFGGHVPSGGVVSPDETLVAGPGLQVRDRRTGERVDLDVAEGERWAVVAWEDDAHVLVRGPAGDVRRCDAATGDCGR